MIFNPTGDLPVQIRKEKRRRKEREGKDKRREMFAGAEDTR
jgi:hypothetical protein